MIYFEENRILGNVQSEKKYLNKINIVWVIKFSLC